MVAAQLPKEIIDQATDKFKKPDKLGKINGVNLEEKRLINVETAKNTQQKIEKRNKQWATKKKRNSGRNINTVRYEKTRTK